MGRLGGAEPATGISRAQVVVNGNLSAAIAQLQADMASGDASLDSRLDVVEPAVTALQAVDVALDARLDIIEALDAAFDGRLDALEAIKDRAFLPFGAAAVTAGLTGRYLNPPGIGTTPASTTIKSLDCPVDGFLRAIHYHVSTPHTTNTVELRPRIAGVETDVNFDVAASDARVSQDVPTPLAVTKDMSVACRIDHNGATDLANCTVFFEFSFAEAA